MLTESLPVTEYRVQEKGMWYKPQFVIRPSLEEFLSGGLFHSLVVLMKGMLARVTILVVNCLQSLVLDFCVVLF